ncbi:MAG: acyltransferase family protein [Burkholderiaceae bacterium]|nr:acyltransferase family protein [Burkholderiaceae bacterium]
MSSSSAGTSRDRFGWVDFSKGVCILAVVALWVTHEFEHRHIGFLAGQATLLDRFVWFAAPFRMPDFFLISGLFLSRVMDRPWKSYLDTKVVHYLYFFLLWTLIIVPAMWWFGRDTPSSLAEAATQLGGLVFGKPFAMLWFLLYLSIYCVVTRLTWRVPTWIMAPVAVLLMLFPAQTGEYHLDRFGVFFLYFYAGARFARHFFALADWARGHVRLAIGGLLLWVAVNKAIVMAGWTEQGSPGLLVMAFVGISAVIVFSAITWDRAWARWVTYLGRNSIAVYLGFYVPMVLIVEGMLATRWGHQLSVVGLVALAGSVAISVAFFEVARRIGLGFLYERPNWARLKSHRVPAVPFDPESSARLRRA